MPQLLIKKRKKGIQPTTHSQYSLVYSSGKTKLARSVHLMLCHMLYEFCDQADCYLEPLHDKVFSQQHFFKKTYFDTVTDKNGYYNKQVWMMPQHKEPRIEYILNHTCIKT